MAGMSQKTSTEEVVSSYHVTGTVNATARALNLARGTVHYHLRKAGVTRPLVGGRVELSPSEVIKKPRRGKVKRFLFASVQNNTHAHPAWLPNMIAYRDYLATGGDTCDIILGSISYDTQTSQKSVKRGKREAKTHKDWYEPELEPFIKDDPIEIGPGLLWGGNHNSLPTVVEPLLGLDKYSGRRSLIVPHVKQHTRSSAAMPGEAVKFMHTTGAATQSHYIQRRAGIIAESNHVYGALLVELDGDGNWFCRHLVIDGDGTMHDIGPSWADGCVVVENGKVTQGWRLGALNSGDTHVREMAPWVRELTWGEGGIVDALSPMHQFFNDLYSHSSRSHHDFKSIRRMLEKHFRGEESVEDEVMETVAFVRDAIRPDMTSEVVPSNHHEHLERWISDTNWKTDLLNSEFYLECARGLVRSVKAGEDKDLLQIVLRAAGVTDEELGFIPKTGRVIFPDVNGGIECGLHGDKGVNGAKGNNRSLQQLARRINKGHDHTAYLDQTGVGSAGSCAVEMPYERGPTTHSLSHLITYQNTARTLLTLWNGKYRA